MIECSSWENIVAAALAAKNDNETYHYYDKERKRDVIVSAAYVKKMLEIALNAAEDMKSFGDAQTLNLSKTVLIQQAALKSSTPKHPLILRATEDGPGKVGGLSLP